MKVIQSRNVNEALIKGRDLILKEGLEKHSRGGATLEIPCPVTTIYKKPWERVLLYPERDANPFFHFFESLWILAGRNDVKFLSEFNKRISDYSDDGGTFNAPYGQRLRSNFYKDQILEAINILKNDRTSRQVVLQIWDSKDLPAYVRTKDKACNLSVVFYVHNGLLNMTVYNRSNDMVWGAYGANVVQFSMLQEYISAHTKIPMGSYWQVSNSFHVYTDGPGGEVWDRIKGIDIGYTDFYSSSVIEKLIRIDEPEKFDKDLITFFNKYDFMGLRKCIDIYQSTFFNSLVVPMLQMYVLYKEGYKIATVINNSDIKADDWRIACGEWIKRRNGIK